FAQVPFHSAGAQHGASDPERDAVLRIQNADALGALHPDAVGGQQLFILIELGQEEIAERLAILLEAVVRLVEAAPDAEGMGGEAGAAILLEDSQDLFAIAETIEQRGNRADVERVRAQPDLVARDTAKLSEDYADILRPRRRFHAEQLLDRFAIAQPVGNRGHVIHAVHIG